MIYKYIIKETFTLPDLTEVCRTHFVCAPARWIALQKAATYGSRTIVSLTILSEELLENDGTK